MPASESRLSVSESIRMLSTISSNVTQVCKDVRNEPDFTTKDVAPLLDALTFFFPTIPNDGRVYAMTLAVTEKEIVATISANDADHFDPAPEHLNAYPESRHSPETILKTIWGIMKKLSTNANDGDQFGQMIKYLHYAHALKIRHRFEKRSKEFERFWTALSDDKAVSNAASDPTCTVASSGNEMYDLSIGCHYAKTSNALKTYLEKAKAIFDCHQAFASTNDVIEVLKQIPLPPPCSKLEKSLSDYDKGYLIKIRHAADLYSFNHFRYIRKLCAPMLHINTIKKTAGAHTFKTLSVLPLRIYKVANIPCTQIQVPAVSPELVAEFLRNAYENPQEDEIDYLQNAINDRAKCARKGTLPISASHCECLLVRHHELLNSSVPPPFPYIGVSKLSCFQCGIYLDAYNASAKRSHENFLIRGRRNDVIPCFLPTISDELDVMIADYMVESIRHVVTAILNKDIRKLDTCAFLSNHPDLSQYRLTKVMADGSQIRREPGRAKIV